LLHLVGYRYYLYQCRTVKQTSNSVTVFNKTSLTLL